MKNDSENWRISFRLMISDALPNGEVTFSNQIWLDYAGMSFEDMRDFGYHSMMHPDEILIRHIAKNAPIK